MIIDLNNINVCPLTNNRLDISSQVLKSFRLFLLMVLAVVKFFQLCTANKVEVFQFNFDVVYQVLGKHIGG